MAKCYACEMDFDDSLVNCPYCGAPSEQYARILVFSRSKSVWAGNGSAQIIVNNENYGYLRNGSELEALAHVGKCEISILSYGDGPFVKRRNNYEFIIKKSSENFINIHVGHKAHATFFEFVIESVSGI